MSLTVKNVLLLDNVDPAAEGILKENGIESTLYKEKLTEEALVAKLKVCCVIVVRLLCYCCVIVVLLLCDCCAIVV